MCFKKPKSDPQFSIQFQNEWKLIFRLFYQTYFLTVFRCKIILFAECILYYKSAILSLHFDDIYLRKMNTYNNNNNKHNLYSITGYYSGKYFLFLGGALIGCQHLYISLFPSFCPWTTFTSPAGFATEK